MPSPDGRGNAARRVRDTTPGPWTAWKKMSRAARCIKFIETYCRTPKGEGWGKPMRLGDFQKDWLEEVLAAGVESAVLPSPRGNGKSSFGGAVATWATFDDTETGAPSVPCVAVTISQGVRGCYGTAASMVRNEPELANRSLEFTGITQPRIYVPRTEGSMFPVAQDIAGLQGLDPSFAILDEVGFVSDAVWSSLILAAGKRSRSLIWATGTPGLDRNNALWTLREKVMSGRTPVGMRYKEYAADPDCASDDREQWRKANPAIGAGFLRESALESALESVPDAHFRVFRLGLWVDGVQSWLGEDGRAVWKALEDPWELVADAPSWVGVDVGIKRDSTAVCIVQKREDGRLHAQLRLWLPTKDEPVDVTDVMAHLLDLTKTYKVGAISFDPRFFDVPAKLLYDQGLPMVEVPQSAERMTPIIGLLYERLKSGALSHDKDAAFETQVLAAVARINERGFTLSKGRSRGRIDAAIALALAVDRADHATRPRPAVFVL